MVLKIMLFPSLRFIADVFGNSTMNRIYYLCDIIQISKHKLAKNRKLVHKFMKIAKQIIFHRLDLVKRKSDKTVWIIFLYRIWKLDNEEYYSAIKIWKLKFNERMLPRQIAVWKIIFFIA